MARIGGDPEVSIPVSAGDSGNWRGSVVLRGFYFIHCPTRRNVLAGSPHVVHRISFTCFCMVRSSFFMDCSLKASV
jgi:hypothetical protein